MTGTKNVQISEKNGIVSPPLFLMLGTISNPAKVIKKILARLLLLVPLSDSEYMTG